MSPLALRSSSRIDPIRACIVAATVAAFIVLALLILLLGPRSTKRAPARRKLQLAWRRVPQKIAMRTSSREKLKDVA